MYTNLLSKLKHSLDSYLQISDLEAIYFGNDCYQNFYSNFNFSHHIETLMRESIGHIMSPDTLFVIGCVNLNQVQQIKNTYESLEGKKKYVIHLKNSISEKYLEKSYFCVGNLNEYIPVDLEYNKFPYDLDEVVELVKQLKQQGFK